MTPEESEHELELLLERQARIAAKIQRWREARKQQEVNPVRPPETSSEGRRETRGGFKVFTPETRQALDKLTRGNGATRELARQAARLLIQSAND